MYPFNQRDIIIERPRELNRSRVKAGAEPSRRQPTRAQWRAARAIPSSCGRFDAGGFDLGSLRVARAGRVGAHFGDSRSESRPASAAQPARDRASPKAAVADLRAAAASPTETRDDRVACVRCRASRSSATDRPITEPPHAASPPPPARSLSARPPSGWPSCSSSRGRSVPSPRNAIDTEPVTIVQVDGLHFVPRPALDDVRIGDLPAPQILEAELLAAHRARAGGAGAA